LLVPIAVLAILDNVGTGTCCALVGDDLSYHAPS
jgi:hypothetical protein